ncbi:hypothetical protein [Halocatena pleomorpha]|uniref:M23 family metallopeptidase n=1 Tax=Halocatena pleomorpha TaxID=1785090 RepID=A0A3P3R8N7_9EURY|nr:hypothetical protein [Halocatena pleomorpha]RRJ28903.1 hypothetical protein EIK79_14410 [Halocatena pleomorpha]
MPTLSGDVLGEYQRFSLYNSPYTAHDSGCAIDLYPEPDETIAHSPVAGTVFDTQRVRAPETASAAAHDHLLLLDTGASIARLLHVDPTVEPGDSVAVGDPIGTFVWTGFFDPWVDNHIHLGFRPSDADPYRASGSLSIEVDVPLRALAWDGTGRVVERGETYVVLDQPEHPDPGACFVGVATDVANGSSASSGVLDGGCPHYPGGGWLAVDGAAQAGTTENVALAGTPIGRADGRDVQWDSIEITANGTPITGLSFFLARDSFGVKLICPNVRFDVGEHITVTVQRD